MQRSFLEREHLVAHKTVGKFKITYTGDLKCKQQRKKLIIKGSDGTLRSVEVTGLDKVTFTNCTFSNGKLLPTAKIIGSTKLDVVLRKRISALHSIEVSLP
jgi:hypothetical protein